MESEQGKKPEVELRPDQMGDEAAKKDDHRRASIATGSGIEFFPFAPTEDMIRLEDIVNAISNKCRYTGQLKDGLFYSVAQHSMFVSKILRAQKASPVVQLQGLLHDAPEAYGPDIASPIKQFVSVRYPGGEVLSYREHEGRVEKVIFDALGIPHPMAHEVHVADAEAFRHEYRQLMPPLLWWRGDPPKGNYPDISRMDNHLARELFYRMYRGLMMECEELSKRGTWGP